MSDKKPDKFVVKKLSEKQVKPVKVSVKKSEVTEESMVTVEFLRHNRYIHKNPHTGKEYIWSGAGALVSVPEKDAAILLAKTRRVGGCCGSKPHLVKIFIRR